MSEHRTPINVHLRMSDKDFMQMTASAGTFGPSFAHIIEQRPGLWEAIDVEKPNSIRANWVWEYSFMTASELILAKSYLTALNVPFETVWDAGDYEDEKDSMGRYIILTDYNAHDNFNPESCPDCGNHNPGGHFADCPRLPDYLRDFPKGAEPIPPRLRTQARISLGDFRHPPVILNND